MQRPIGGGLDAARRPVGSPRRSSRACATSGSRTVQSSRGPGNRQYGCQPKETGTATPAVASTTVSTRTRRRPTRTDTASVCGNGNASNPADDAVISWRASMRPRPSAVIVQSGRPIIVPWIGRPLPSVCSGSPRSETVCPAAV